MKRITLSLLIFVIVFIGACSQNKAELSTQDRLNQADELYSRGKYAKAALIYDDISFERKSAATAYATLRLADSYFAMNKFTDARLKYQQFIDAFPDHANVPDAHYRIAVCYFESSKPAQLDQHETLQSIEAFRNFIERYPNDSRYDEAIKYIKKAQYKLIEKKYLNGYIYYKMKDYSAALMYFNEVIELGNTDELDKKSLYYSALLHRHQKNYDLAMASYQSLAKRYPNSKELIKLSKKFGK